MTPEELSLVKAHYFRSILAVAKSYDRASALRLIHSLANDIPTPNTAPELAMAEKAAIAAARSISDSLQTEQRNVVVPWNDATHALRQWLVMLGDEPL